MTFDVNDKKHFDASIAYDRFKKVNGYTYKPRVYLGVNGERVMELQGIAFILLLRKLCFICSLYICYWRKLTEQKIIRFLVIFKRKISNPKKWCAG